MSEGRVIGAYIRIAAGDLADAKILPPESRNIAQLLFQAAEKITLALLASENIHPSFARLKTGNHQLEGMVGLLPDENPLKPDLKSVAALTSYATTYRYPTGSGRIPDSPLQDSTDRWIGVLDRVLARCATGFGIDLTQAQPIASRPGPLR